ncbi:MAG: aminotransferase class I/II-fold pyridoxal phosphate-dependent enzyme [candidate division Zixibacteria bacterium]
MPMKRFRARLTTEVDQVIASGTAKGVEQIVTEVCAPTDSQGARVKLDGFGGKLFLRMNSNSYLGMSLRKEIIQAEEAGARRYGVGPGAVRFISGSYRPHIELEEKLAAFHNREACMLTSSAYTSVMGIIAFLSTPETIIISDELNHNCIIMGMRMARPKGKAIYKHRDMDDLEAKIQDSIGKCDNLLVITDGIFSMRGAYAPLDKIAALVSKYNDQFANDIVLMVDDSHGVGSMGKTGRGTEEFCKAEGVDILVATLGKALGVNGGYIVSDESVIRYLREKNSFYIYTNPITPSEATASIASLDLLDSERGAKILEHLQSMTAKFEKGLVDLGYETIPSPHPVTPLMVRDTELTTEVVSFLLDHGILATGLNFPVVPKGDQSIRFQVTADHTESDIDYVLSVLAKFKNK